MEDAKKVKGAKRVPLGLAHGRFQVLHNHHMRYILAAREKCRHLVVGITNPDPETTRDDPADANRSDAAANPLTYWERQAMVRESLVWAGVAPMDFTIVPFPINLPRLWFHYVPREAVFYLTIYDGWGRQKQAMLSRAGLDVRVLWDWPAREKGITASQVRELISQDGDWQSLVPPPVARIVENQGLAARIRQALD